MIFNNVTSLPLILLSSLGDNGTLDPLVGKGESLSEVLDRGKVSRNLRGQRGEGMRWGWEEAKTIRYTC